MIVILQEPAKQDDMRKAQEHYPGYAKITIDIKKEKVAIGGEYHFDAEQKLLEIGCKQDDIWGGGIELESKTIETNAMINVRAKINPHQDIQDEKIKKKFLIIAYKYLRSYANKPTVLP